MNFDKWYGEIKELVEKSENPLFFFDDDTDGLSSFLVLWKHIKRGKGIIVKRYPDLDVSFLKKVKEYNPDRIFVLDKYDISQDFIDGANKPIVWIDHHTPQVKDGLKHYYNPRLKDKSMYLPTTYFCYKSVKGSLWLALCGIIGDYYLPSAMVKEFNKEYPNLIGKAKDPGKVLYETEFGKLIKIMNFSIKGETEDVKKSIAVWMKIETPYEVLNSETSKGKFLMKRFEKLDKQYLKLYEGALKEAKSNKKLVVFNYPSNNTSFTGDLANEISYRYPEKVVIIARERNGYMRMSVRNKKQNLPSLLEKALVGVNGYGGGHEGACGANVLKEDYSKFLENLRKLI